MPNQPVRLTILFCAASSAALAQLVIPTGRAQIEQARQAPLPEAHVTITPKPAASADFDSFDTDFDDAFGAQVILKENVIEKAFTGWAEVAGFYTNNVALARRGTLQDTFLTNTFGLSYHKALKPTLVFDATLRGSLYRYNRFNELDFQSIDPSISLTWLPKKLENTALYIRYAYNQLTTASSGDEFFSSHSVAIGAQKVWPIARAHSIFAGVQAQWSWADPSDVQRDEYSAFVGYHADIARKFTGDLNYRFAYYDYRESAAGRRDANHSVSLAFRYALEEWLAVSASTYLSTNRSNIDAFSYDVWNLGGSIGLSTKF
jgi:hypothetical protein